jgi:hypothetical protein
VPCINDADDEAQVAQFCENTVQNGGLSAEFKRKFPKNTFRVSKAAQPRRVIKASRSKGAKPTRVKGSRRISRSATVQRAGTESGDSDGGSGDGKPPDAHFITYYTDTQRLSQVGRAAI